MGFFLSFLFLFSCYVSVCSIHVCLSVIARARRWFAVGRVLREYVRRDTLFYFVAKRNRTKSDICTITIVRGTTDGGGVAGELYEARNSVRYIQYALCGATLDSSTKRQRLQVWWMYVAHQDYLCIEIYMYWGKRGASRVFYRCAVSVIIENGGIEDVTCM